MSNKQQKKIPYRPFESLSEKSDHKYINENGKLIEDYAGRINYSMVTSAAFRSLTPRQQMLYVYSRIHIFAAKSSPAAELKDENGKTFDQYSAKRGAICFYLNRGLFSGNPYNLYPASNKRDFYDDVEALVQRGFIERITNTQRLPVSETSHQRNVFRHSEAWKQITPDRIAEIEAAEAEKKKARRKAKS